MLDSVYEHLLDLQNKICKDISIIDKKDCFFQPWASPQEKTQGQGIITYFNKGQLLEKGCANISTIHGHVTEKMQHLIPQHLYQEKSKYFYSVASMGLIFHPYSPFVPSVHSHYRYFEITDESKNVLCWYFGGGADLTPYYLVEDEAIHFHKTLKEACDKVNPNLYQPLKKEADKYLYIPHRKEHRGIGGVFSLRLHDRPKEEAYDWFVNCSNSFLDCYVPIVKNGMDKSFNERNRKWQLLRRAHYVEFNLIYDTGFHFALHLDEEHYVKTVFMSMPPVVEWDYDFIIEPNSPEEDMQNVLKCPRDWV